MAGTKDRVDLIMGGQKSLCLSGRFEPPHQLLSFAGRSMRSFDAVVEPFVRPKISFRRKSPDRLDVTAQFDRHDDTRFAKAGDQPRKETLGDFGISARLNKDIQHVPVRIDRPLQPLLHAVDRNDDFVQMPIVGSGGTVMLDAIGKMPTKPVRPFAHGFPADGYTAFSQQILDARRAEREAMIGQYGKGHDFTGETIAFRRGISVGIFMTKR